MEARRRGLGKARAALAFCAACWAAVAVCAEALGPLAEAQKRYSEVFIPGNVLEYTVAGEPGYLFNGEAEQFFTGPYAEPDSELYRQAERQARLNLLNFFAKDRKDVQLSLSGVRLLYHYAQGTMRRVVCFVPKRGVTVEVRQAQMSDLAPLAPLDPQQPLPEPSPLAPLDLQQPLPPAVPLKGEGGLALPKPAPLLPPAPVLP